MDNTLHFTPLSEEGLESIARSFDPAGEEVAALLADVLAGAQEDTEYAVSAARGCLLLRIFDMGRYLFCYPYPLTEEADAPGAVEELALYTVWQEIPLVLTDVPAEEIGGLFARGFRHITADAEDPDAATFRVQIATECQLTEKVPTVPGEGLLLTPWREDDVSAYARLCRDEGVNRFWGYDYREDDPARTDAAFSAVREEEWIHGVALSVAIRRTGPAHRTQETGALLGEGVLFAFDGRGGARAALRLFPDAQGQGWGRRAMSALCELAARIGLVRLTLECMTENSPSVALLSHFGEPLAAPPGLVRRTLALL